MKIHSTPNNNYAAPFSGNLFQSLRRSVAKRIEPVPVLTEKNRNYIDKIEDIALKKYNKVTGEPVILTVKNGDKEFSFKYNNSVWHRIHIGKKGQEVADFEILHVKNDKKYAFYSTGEYHCKIIDEKFIKKYNCMLEDWLPRLVKRIEKLDKNQENRAINI